MDDERALQILRSCQDTALAKAIDPEDLSRAIRVAVEELHENRSGLAMRGSRGAPDWMGFETSIWRIGEIIRGFLRIRRDIRGECALMSTIAEVAVNKKYGKGRQTFALLIGEYGKGAYGDTIKSLLCDDEVYGHALDSALKARIPGLRDRAREIADSRAPAWIRSTARRYLKRTEQ